MNWIDLVKDRNHWETLVSMVMNVQVTYNFGKFFRSCRTCGFSRRAQLHELISLWEPSMETSHRLQVS
jgi:hypothetical protein